MATYPIKHINSEMRGAPVITGNTRGNVIAAVDAWRLGFAQVTAIGVTVANGVATAQLQPGQSFDLNAVVDVAGAVAPMAALNGESRVIELVGGGPNIRFPTTAPNGTATGTITIKVAGSGWDKPFSGPNNAMYRSSDPIGSRFFYNMNETGVTNMARVRGFENATSVTAGTGLFPTNAQINGGGYWVKSSMTDAAPVRYDIVGDSRFVLVMLAPGVSSGSSYIAANVRGFGEPLALNPAGDPYAACISCNQYSNSGDPQYGTFGGASSLGAGAIFAARSRLGTGTAKDQHSRPFVGGSGASSGEDPFLGPLPDPVDGRLKFSQYFIHDDSGTATPTARAIVPGLLHVPQSGLRALISARDIVIGSGALEGRILMAIPTSLYATSAGDGFSFVDLTGPWRIN